MDPKVSGKLVLVTGSSGGIGKAIAAAYYKAGARVLVNGRSEASVSKAVEDLKTAASSAAGVIPGGELLPLVGDVGSKEGVDALLSSLKAVSPHADGGIDILVANVGVYGVKEFADITDEEWLNYYNVNVMSCVRLARAFLKGMLERNDGGRILFISSEVGARPLPHMTAYSMSKAAQVNLARGLAELTKGTSVTVNSVLPGPTWTEGVEKYLADYAKSKGWGPDADAEKLYFAENETTSLLQRFLRPEEVANTVLFLGSALGSGVNGHAQRVEGGIIRHI